MKCLLLLTVVAVGYCAPVGEQEQVAGDTEQDDIRVKRAKEVMMFGNQQIDENNKEKRSDPMMEEEDETRDKYGSIVAEDPVDIEPENDEQPVDTVIPGEFGALTKPVEGDDNTEDGDEEAEPTNESDSDLGDVMNGEPDSEEINEEQDEIDYQNYLKGLQDEELTRLLMGRPKTPSSQYDSWQVPDYSTYNGIPWNLRYRYRRSQKRPFNGHLLPKSHALKRSRRIKRELMFSDDDDSYLNMPYESYRPDDSDLSYLLDLLENARVYDDGEIELNREYPYDDLSGLAYDSLPGYYVPKRQAGLSYLPGVKRNIPFPYYEEPYTHFSAFVPEKRDYDDEYERVMQLAAALRRQNYYPEDFGYEYDFRKK